MALRYNETTPSGDGLRHNMPVSMSERDIRRGMEIHSLQFSFLKPKRGGLRQLQRAAKGWKVLELDFESESEEELGQRETRKSGFGL